MIQWYSKYINNYIGIKPENIIKLKHYIHNGLSICQNKYSETMFLDLTRLAYIILNRPVADKTTFLRQKSPQIRPKKTTRFFFKAHWTKQIKPTKKTLFVFSLKKFTKKQK